MTKFLKGRHLVGVAGAALSLATFQPAFAQSGPADEPQSVTTGSNQNRTAVDASDVVVINGIGYRDRTDETAPVLVYGDDYFQRFEPLTAGDALKRVPSVTFLSDVLESDGVRLRGLDPAYTQILINGEEVPGAGSSSGAIGNGADTAFFVDRIPAELISKVEIVRSASANRSGDAMAGAINIVLKDGYALEGGYVRLGALAFDDGRVRESAGAVWGGKIGEGRLLLGASVQGRHNPKRKTSLRYDDIGEDLNNSEIQRDTRDGTDYSANFAWETPVGENAEFTLDGFYVKTERYQDEDSIEYDEGVQTPGSITVVNSNDVDIEQESLSLNGGYKIEAFGGKTSFKLGYASFKDDTFEFENEMEYARDGLAYPEADRFTRDLAPFAIDDNEIKAKIDHERAFGDLEFQAGVHFKHKERDTTLGEGRFRTNIPGAAAQIPNSSGAGVPGYTDPAIAYTTSNIKRTNVDPYALVRGDAGAISWEAGVRVENMTLEVDGDETDQTEVLPSAHFSWEVSDAGRIRGSVARTIRNAPFEFLFSGVLEEELGSNDFQGNPNLKPETAWGLDIGYEQQLGKSGIAGVNFFYRDVKDLIEIYNTGDEGSANDAPDDLAYIFGVRNTGDGKVYGVEFDLSSDLSAIGLPDTGVFANYSWLDSDVDDEFGSRRFNSQSEYVYNFGFIHDISAWDAAFGATYRKQGDAKSRVVGEEVVTSYGADLEIFVEKSFGDNFTLRFVGSNLLDSEKEEEFRKYALLANQIDGSIDDEYELEREEAGPVYQIIGRMSF
ncbi:MAG TPA: TonB-dependent receptor [Hyphomonadaceae bacterium]|nr:TonB-dependent receptor [Hyphomonadaceae bacterium]HPI46938.1 TonB-dependent receptor [Hyphomonadaceae bacterium]